MPGRRTVVREKVFERDLRLILDTHAERADAFLAGVEELLSRTPEMGLHLPESSVWAVGSEPTAEHQVPLVIFYTFDDETVNLLGVMKPGSMPKA